MPHYPWLFFNFQFCVNKFDSIKSVVRWDMSVHRAHVFPDPIAGPVACLTEFSGWSTLNIGKVFWKKFLSGIALLESELIKRSPFVSLEKKLFWVHEIFLFDFFLVQSLYRNKSTFSTLVFHRFIIIVQRVSSLF